MGAFSTYSRSKTSDNLLRGTTFASPGQVYLALFTSDPGAAGTGTEAAFTGYARQSCGATPASAFSAVDTNGTTQNQNSVTFPAVGGSVSVTVVSWALFDAVTGGNMLLYGALTTSKTLDPADVASFAPNALRITFN